MSVRWRAYAATLLALAGGDGAAEAQTIRATLGDSARVQVAAGTKVRVPIILDLTAAGGRTLAQLLAGVTWGTNRLTYDSVRVVGAAGLTVQVDATSAGSGSLALTADWGTPLSGSATLLHLWFTAGPASGGARVALSPTAATSGTAENILGLLRPEGHDVCAAFGALWGDVNGTGSVNITDAQQIARWTTGLVVGNAPLVVRRGDVTALNGVNIVDAQQIARWATGLSATAPRINAQLLEYPSASTIVVVPTTATVTEGGAVTIVATVRDSVNNSLAGCYPVAWSTSNAGVATVSNAGIVTAVAPGVATITATSGSLTADATITVGARATTLAALSALTQNGTAGGAVATLPSVKATDVRGDPVAGVTVTFAVASGGGSVTGGTATTDASGIATVGSWTLGTVPGTNTVTATATGLSGSPVTFSATGAPDTLTVGGSFTANDKSYDGTTAATGTTTGLTLVGVASGDTVTLGSVTLAFATAAAGTDKTVSITGLTLGGAQAYRYVVRLAGAPTAAASITPGTSTVTVTGDSLTTYDGTAQGPTTANVTGSTGAVTWSYAGRNATSYGPSATPPTNAGEYTATATVAADANYAGATSAAFAFRIAAAAQAALTLTVEPTSVAVGATAALGTTGGSGTGAVSYSVTTGGTVCSASGATLNALTAGSCTVTATKAADANYLEATSAAATVTVYGTAAALAVSREPAGAVSGVSFTTQPRVEVRDAGGRLVTSSTASVTAAIASGTGTLTGTTTVSAVAGVATFTNLVITGGGAHTLAFTATDLTSASSSSFTVTLPEGATVSKVSAAALSGYTSNFIANAPAVRVLTSGGAPIPGVAVSWSTDAGSLVERNSGVTDVTGTAALLGWQLGGSAGTQTASAAVAGRTAVDFAATVTAPPASQFNIEVRYLGTPPSAARQAVFAAAAARWSELIVGDLVPVTINLAADPDGCYPALDETVDDLLIFVTVGAIDGPGSILGGARPCLVRSTDSLPVVGEMIFDEDDLPSLEADGQFDEVILHEMGHVLGLGSFWGYKPNLTGAGTPDPYFTGSTARAAFIAATGISGFVGNIVPVENTGGAGTQDSHWRESVFNNELMTGYLDAGINPLSAISSASLRDLGYVVNDTAADAFSLESGVRLPGGPRRQLRELPFDKPIQVVDRAGRITRSIVPR